MDGFPSGQRGQTVNLLSTTSKVRILLHPLCRRGGIGRRTGLKILRGQTRTGSSPVAGIKQKDDNHVYTLVIVFLFILWFIFMEK